MRSRLFWKIFWNFAITFLLQLVIMWILFTFVTRPDVRIERLVAERSAPQMLDLAARLVQSGGPGALPQQDLGVRLRIARDTVPGRTVDKRYTRFVSAPDRRPYRLDVILPPVTLSSGIIAPEVYLVGLVTGLLSAASLAFYLARPIRVLKRGFDAFAGGALETRLTGRIGNRRDEIADLARDFDGMANKIEQLVRARDQLLDDVSHELRSPLTRLQLAIALARQNPNRRVDALDRIEREAARLDTLIGELLTLSRLETGAPLIEGYFDLTALIEEVTADARFEGRPDKIAIVTSCEGLASGSALDMHGDPELMRRVFENILRNALRFSPAKGTICVTIQCLDNIAVIAVTDEGPGVPADQLGELFTPFVKGLGGGWGLGLAIARRAVLAHSGLIEARNDNRAGLCVTISLPLGGIPLD